MDFEDHCLKDWKTLSKWHSHTFRQPYNTVVSKKNLQAQFQIISAYMSNVK